MELASVEPVATGEIPEIWKVERLDIDGEELPILRHTRSWLPAPLALRYSLKMRFVLSPTYLFSELRGVCILYNWAEATEGVGDIEAFLTTGGALGKADLLRLVTQLRRQHDVRSTSPSRL